MRTIADITDFNAERGTNRPPRTGIICAGILAAFTLCGAETAPAVVTGYDFARYQVILDKKPFGEITPSEIVQPQAALGEVFTKEFEMKAIVDDGSGIRIGLLDKKANKSFFLSVGEIRDGLQLVSVDYENEEAVIKKGGETTVVKLRPDKDKDKGKEMAALPSAVPMGMGETPFQPPTPSPAAAARRPFFSDLKRRRASPFQPLGTNQLPFQAKSADSFFKVSTGAFPQAQSPLGPFQVPQGNATPGVFQPVTPAGVSNAPALFTPPNPNAQTSGRGTTIDQLLQRQSGGGEEQVQPGMIQVPAEGEIPAEEIVQ